MTHILLADDDADDRLIFEEALSDLSLKVSFKAVENGLKLMQLLKCESQILPDIVFLDLNMPLQTGHECLKEIKADTRFKNLTVVIYSTSLNLETVDELYEDGADYYICKPGAYGTLKRILQKAIALVGQKSGKRVSKNEFIVTP